MEKVQGEAFNQKVLFTVKVLLCAFAVIYVLLNTFDLLLLLFAGILMAIFFSGLAHFLSSRTGLSYKWSLLLVVVLLALFWFVVGRLVAPSLVEQARTLKESIPHSISSIESWLREKEWAGKFDFQNFLVNDSRGIFSKATSALSNLSHGLLNGLILLFVGLYLAYSPETYLSGLLRLFPKERRKRMEEVLREAGHTLRWWLIGRFIDMTFIGVLTWIGLFFLNVPLALILALAASVLNFIPNIGPFLGAIPALLIGLSIDPQLMLHIAILYFIVQSLESVLITPLVQQKVIALPPALTITIQIILGTTFGTIGLLVATPLLAGLIVIVKRLYINDVLKDLEDQKMRN